MDLSNKTILITGGGTGIGLALARAFAGSGSTVVICGRTMTTLSAAAAESPGLVPVHCDVTEDGDVSSMLAKIEHEFGGLDILVNNAAIMNFYDFGTDADAAVKAEQEVTLNLIAPMKLIAKALPLLKKRKGTIVQMNSSLAYVPLAAAPVYCATKAGLHFFSRSLRRQLSATGVKVVDVLAPLVDTQMTASVKNGPKRMDPARLAEEILSGLRGDRQELVVGISKQLRFMSRLAPAFIERKLADVRG